MEIDIKGYKVLIDDEDFDLINQYSWFVDKKKCGKNYIRSKTKNYNLYMHRLLLGEVDKINIDHINGDTLDNRKCNLRKATVSQNMYNCKKRKDNKSGYKGVSWRKDNKKWMAKLNYEKRPIHLGYFETAELAYYAYCESAKKYHGEFANFG